MPAEGGLYTQDGATMRTPALDTGAQPRLRHSEGAAQPLPPSPHFPQPQLVLPEETETETLMGTCHGVIAQAYSWGPATTSVTALPWRSEWAQQCHGDRKKRWRWSASLGHDGEGGDVAAATRGPVQLATQVE